jgi:hypothetical protein
MNLRKMTLKYFGWCPGVKAAAEFLPEKEYNFPLYALILFILGLIIVQTTSVNTVFYESRVTFLVLLGAIVLIGLVWKRFKPKDWTLEEFEYHPLTVDELPDLPIDASYTWGSKSSMDNPALGIDRGMRGTDMEIEMRQPDIEYYRGTIAWHRAIREQQLRGVTPTEMQLEERPSPYRLERPVVRPHLTPKVFALSIVIFLSCVFVIYQLYTPPPEGPLVITVGTGPDKLNILDGEIDPSFNYTQLFGTSRRYKPPVIFRERLNASEFAEGDSEVYDLSLSSLDEVCLFAEDDVGAPNVIIGLVRFLLEQNFDETYVRIWGEPIEPDLDRFSLYVGDKNVLLHNRGIHYEVTRARHSSSYDDGYHMEIREGLLVKKCYERELIWEFRVDALEIYIREYSGAEDPRYMVQFIRYPRGVRDSYN